LAEEEGRISANARACVYGDNLSRELFNGHFEFEYFFSNIKRPLKLNKSLALLPRNDSSMSCMKTVCASFCLHVIVSASMPKWKEVSS
jgi:hypothetical protein